MTRRSIADVFLVVCLAAGSFIGGSAAAQSVADFYKRNGIVLIIGSGAGGGFDAYGRIFALHFAHHVPGNPNIVIKNMPGAAGLVAINYLSNSAPRDGSSILASFNTVVLNSLYGDPNAKFDPREFGWLGSLGKATGTCLTWYTSPVKTIEQAESREVLVGATGDGSNPTTYPK
ncbi:MAG TPA: hypothetical protein VG271_05055, partial [Beijerinckiaceae bacterium]|nr:hypothetical protein [Beijerinckiaceae bacterium]